MVNIGESAKELLRPESDRASGASSFIDCACEYKFVWDASILKTTRVSTPRAFPQIDGVFHTIVLHEDPLLIGPARRTRSAHFSPLVVPTVVELLADVRLRVQVRLALIAVVAHFRDLAGRALDRAARVGPRLLPSPQLLKLLHRRRPPLIGHLALLSSIRPSSLHLRLDDEPASSRNTVSAAASLKHIDHGSCSV